MDAQYSPVLHNIRVLEAVHHRLRILKMLLLGAELKQRMVKAILNATPPTACNTATASNQIADKSGLPARQIRLQTCVSSPKGSDLAGRHSSRAADTL